MELDEKCVCVCVCEQLRSGSSWLGASSLPLTLLVRDELPGSILKFVQAIPAAATNLALL
ncbi:hypothetical protein BX600DRAFT_454462 [Xylariales sp. PMI_506]|nr:hypothetical protein BX600DRAFT_454462 [Xylariales sp. PMI_506]